MGERTAIAWTDHTFNPWMGCAKVSPGCANCYAETLVSGRMGIDVWGPSPRKRTSVAYWKQPAKWNRAAKAAGKRARVFCGSLCDVFEDRPELDQIRATLFTVIAATPWLDWQLLTKRPENARMVPREILAGLPNVWLGTSIESRYYLKRAEILRAIPAAVHFISYEPALGPIHDDVDLDLAGIDWLIYGGESGQHYRPHDLAWARGIRDRCVKEGVAFFYKQGSGPRPGQDDVLDGVEWKQFPVEFQ